MIWLPTNPTEIKIHILIALNPNKQFLTLVRESDIMDLWGDSFYLLKNGGKEEHE